MVGICLIEAERVEFEHTDETVERLESWGEDMEPCPDVFLFSEVHRPVIGLIRVDHDTSMKCGKSRKGQRL